MRGEAGKFFGRGKERGSGFGRQVQKAGEFVDFRCAEGCAFDAELGEGGA